MEDASKHKELQDNHDKGGGNKKRTLSHSKANHLPPRGSHFSSTSNKDMTSQGRREYEEKKGRLGQGEDVLITMGLIE